jgi:hypothetical protein
MMEKKSKKAKKPKEEARVELSEAYVIEADKDGLPEEEEGLDVAVSFDGFRFCLDFDDGNKYLIIFDRFLSALNELADDAGWEEEGVEELEQLAKTARKVLSAKK